MVHASARAVPARPEGWITIADLVEITGVTKATIHHYLQLGLIAQPIKTNRRMAYYNPATADRIRFIKELQEKRFLPLREIRSILADSTAAELRRVDRGVLEADRGGPWYTRERLAELHGVPAELIDRLVAIELLSPRDGRFSAEDERIVFFVKEMQAAGLDEGLGFAPEELRLFVEHCAHLIDAEFALFNARVLGKRPPEEAVRLARAAIALTSRLLGALHYRKMLERLRALRDASGATGAER